MRVLSGSLRQREIKIPTTLALRPTSSKLKMQVFNICQGWTKDGYALDLFAGSGAIGIEAISRGMAHCTFVENDRQAVMHLKATIHSLQLESVTAIVPGDVLRALQNLSCTSHPFSFVYIDPPYALIDPLQEILRMIDAQLPLKPGAYVFLETRKKSFTPQLLPTLPLITQRTSGDSDLWHFEKA